MLHEISLACSPTPSLEQLSAHLGILEQQLWQLCLPFLELDERALLNDAQFLIEIKVLAARTKVQMLAWAGDKFKEVHSLLSVVENLQSNTAPTKILRIGWGLVKLQVLLRNENASSPVLWASVRLHPAFHPKLRQVLQGQA